MANKILITELSVYPETDNPIFGEGITKISLEDDGAGIYVTISQPNNVHAGVVSFNPDEVVAVFDAIKVILDQDGV